MRFVAALKKQAVVTGAVVLWVPVVAFGIVTLWKCSATPGRLAAPPLYWPEKVKIKRAEKRATLLIFAHPRCPCSSASLGELAILMAHAGGRVDANVFFYVPANGAGTWARTDLWRDASNIPGVRAF